MKAFLSTRRTVGGLTQLRPLLVSFKKSQYQKHSWCYEYRDNDAYVAHRDALYQLTFDPTRVNAYALIDAIHAARTLVRSPFSGELAAIPIKVRDIPASRQLLVSDLVKIHWSSSPPTAIRPDFETLFNFRTGTSGDGDWLTWRLVPILLSELRLVYAALFLKASYDQYVFVGVEIEEAILKNDEPSFVHDAVRAEIAVHNAYKVIEAILGGHLPEDAGKLDKGLRDLGINPNKKVGYTHHGVHSKQRISDKIAALRKARNEKAAHGRIYANRKSTHYEILDYQELAKPVLTLHLRHRYPNLGM